MNKRNILFVIMGLMASFLFTSCGENPDALAEEIVSTMEEVVVVLESVKDEESAKAAVSKLEVIAKKMEDLKKRDDATKVTREKQKEIEKKYTERLTKVGTKMLGLSMEIQKYPEIQKTLESMKFL